MRKQTCCFSSHRNLPLHQIPLIRQRTVAVVRKLITEHGVRYFGVGGAVGYDTLAAGILFDLKNEFPHIKIILVYPFDGFTNCWNSAQRDAYTQMLPHYDKVVCAARSPSKEAYWARNRHLVNHSTYCITYCTRDTGGTAYTVRYAREQGVQVFNVAL